MSLFEERNKKFWMQNGDIVRQKYLHVDKVHKKVWKKITETKKNSSLVFTKAADEFKTRTIIKIQITFPDDNRFRQKSVSESR